jgi:hypothetical protein
LAEFTQTTWSFGRTLQTLNQNWMIVLLKPQRRLSVSLFPSSSCQKVCHSSGCYMANHKAKKTVWPQHVRVWHSWWPI